ncbi:hypothetical protein ASPSYDRAFT_1056088 [Aspergillus sydowii CBS 593.65]|uniref:Uncharacterized protein n=1 Tax=Aspergillus sydowii CBS 593.65 TaxID=1036612 RepID=A0A1L9TDH7_9EURO|nr:uncharacterized protein ASPSYDRAFT_1056088 [Aspergillus sydowii CBS 593.65]OJJ57477.1 hypothetical protein ASPSYDRAFT_1056088 [Aspergillus sydowii CBS 593.65]
MPRHRRFSITDSETDYSESDTSMMEYPRTHRRRSISRTRPSYSNTYLSPNRVHEDVRIHRSASTGARRTRQERDRERDRERVERTQPTAVIVDIKNDSRNTSSNKARKDRRDNHREETNHYLDPYESEDETYLRRPQRRARASTSASHSREPSPLQPPRDYDLLIDQRVLEHNDHRQDLELLRQQQEIERLERQLSRTHGEHEVRLIREEEDRYEDDISDRLRRLQRYEEHERLEEEKRKAERRYRLQRLEAAERESAEQEEVRRKLKHERLVELQRKIDEEEERERVKKEIRDEEARRALEEQKKRAEEARMKAAAVEEWKLAEERRRIAEREAAEQRDREFRERLRVEFGYTEEEIEDANKPTWIKVHRKHLLPDTLIAYQLPWSWDEYDGNYMIIKAWISEELQEELFAHSRRLREGKVITEKSNTLTELRVNDRNKDKMYLVRKKSPSRRSWIFT